MSRCPSGPFYDTFEAAAATVDIIRKTGTWPGIVCHADGRYTLTTNPADDTTEET